MGILPLTKVSKNKMNSLFSCQCIVMAWALNGNICLNDLNIKNWVFPQQQKLHTHFIFIYNAGSLTKTLGAWRTFNAHCLGGF